MSGALVTAIRAVSPGATSDERTVALSGRAAACGAGRRLPGAALVGCAGWCLPAAALLTPAVPWLLLDPPLLVLDPPLLVLDPPLVFPDPDVEDDVAWPEVAVSPGLELTTTVIGGVVAVEVGVPPVPEPVPLPAGGVGLLWPPPLDPVVAVAGGGLPVPVVLVGCGVFAGCEVLVGSGGSGGVLVGGGGVLVGGGGVLVGVGGNGMALKVPKAPPPLQPCGRPVGLSGLTVKLTWQVVSTVRPLKLGSNEDPGVKP